MAAEPLKRKPLIYSIDDDPDMNRLMEARFIKFGCEIQTFPNRELLIEAIRKQIPKLLLMDLHLGEPDTGFDLIETLRFKLKLTFPIIVVSAESDSSKVAHALEIGATDFVVKPPLRDRFEEKVAEYIQAENLPDPQGTALRPVREDCQLTKVTFPLSIVEVNPVGFTLVSTHLIRKGASFWLSGDPIKKLIPSAEEVFVTVLGSATQISGDQRSYQIRVEIDTAQDQIVQDLKSFLNSVRIESS